MTLKVVAIYKSERWEHVVDRTEKDEDGKVFYYYKSEKKPLLSTKDFFLFLFLGGFSFYFIWLFLKNAPRIEVSNSFVDIRGLFMRSITIDKDSVASIEFTGRQFFPVLLTWQPAEAATIYLKDGSKVILWDFYYRNSARIKEMLKMFYQGEQPMEQAAYKYSYKEHINGFEPKKFAGNPFTTLNTFTVISTLVFIFLVAGNGGRDKVVLEAMLVVGAALYVLLGFQMYYFILSSETLVIRNHYWPWVNTTYPLDDIEELAFESPHKRSNALRVITKKFKSRLYPAGSLRDRHWRALEGAISQLNLKLRSE